MSRYDKRKIILYACIFVVGLILIIVACIGDFSSVWGGFGGGICAVAGMRLYLANKYKKNPDYAKTVDINNNDERNLYISGKAKSWSFYITVLGCAVGGAILNLIGYEGYGRMLFSITCIMTLIYWIAYTIIEKRN